MSEQQEAYATDPAPIDLSAAVRQLAMWRDSLATANRRMAELRQRLEQESEFQFWKYMADEADQRAAELEKDLRKAAVDAYAETGDKHPHPALGIQVKTRLVYAPDAAKIWCRSNLPAALKLDASFFEKHARAVSQTMPLDFVTVVYEPAATISTDLSHYLIDGAK